MNANQLGLTNMPILCQEYPAGSTLPNEKFLMPMHKDSTCIFIADCCHSGTIADLPFEYCLEPSPHTKRISPLLPQADVFLFSGCRDAQCSQDFGERVGGALTSNLLPMLSGWAKHNGGA